MIRSEVGELDKRLKYEDMLSSTALDNGCELLLCFKSKSIVACKDETTRTRTWQRSHWSHQLGEDMDNVGIDCHVHREIHQEPFVVIERQNHIC